MEITQSIIVKDLRRKKKYTPQILLGSLLVLFLITRALDIFSTYYALTTYPYYFVEANPLFGDKMSSIFILNIALISFLIILYIILLFISKRKEIPFTLFLFFLLLFILNIMSIIPVVNNFQLLSEM